MQNEQPDKKDRFVYVLFGSTIVFVVAVLTCVLVWNLAHPEEVSDNVGKVATMREKASAADKEEAWSTTTIGPYTIQLKDKKVVDCVGAALQTYSDTNVVPTCDWDNPRQLTPNEKANRQATYVTLGDGEQVPCEGSNSYITCGWNLKGKQ